MGRAERPTIASKELDGTTAAFKLIAEQNELFFGVSGRVSVPGRVRVGDPVELV